MATSAMPQQSGGRAPQAEAFHIRQEVLQCLPEASDFDPGVGDPLMLWVKLTAFFTQAALLSNSRRTGTSVNDEQFAIQRALYSYKLSAIQMIRQRLSENPQSPDRNILLGVVTLAGCEFIANNPEEGRLHLEAGLEIAHARGGLCSLSDPELELMCLVDFDLAALSGKTPCTPLSEMEEAVYSRISEERTGHWGKSNLANLDCLRAAKASQTCKGLACLLQMTDGLNSSKYSKPVGQSQKDLVMRGLFAGFLLCSVQPQTPHSSHTGDIDLDEPLRVAGLLVVAATCLQNTPKDHLLDRLTADLALHLQLTPLPLYSPRPRTVASTMLWMYFVGAHGSLASQRQLFFLRGVAQVARLLGLEKWKEVREQLKCFPYVDDEFDGPFEEMWNSAVLFSSLPA
ncbi:hypothetical protein AYO22_02534 [Fonsecaea multimorphosa]|nr:hypothetical protein AYO22_02534 [Fonsecaea multimorphosa]